MHQLVSRLVQVAPPLLTPVLELAATVQRIVDEYKYDRAGKLWLQMRDGVVSGVLLRCRSYTTSMNKTHKVNLHLLLVYPHNTTVRYCFSLKLRLPSLNYLS